MADVLLGFLPLRCNMRGFSSWRAFWICCLNASSWRAMLGAVSSNPHSPMATQSSDAIFPSSQLQSTSSSALGWAPHVRNTLTFPMTAGMCASHSTRNTWLETMASKPSTRGERCSCWKNGRIFWIVACMPDLCRNNSRWQWPSTTHARVGFDAGPCTSLAPVTWPCRSSGNSASILIVILQWSTADMSHGEEVATDSTVPPQYLTNCPHNTCLTTDWAGSRSSNQPLCCASSPSFCHGTPKCSLISSKTWVMVRNQVDNWCAPNLPCPSWTSQCLACKCAWLLQKIWHFQQAFSGAQNHGKWMACTCLRKHFRGSRQTPHSANSDSVASDFSAALSGCDSSGALLCSTATVTVRTSMVISGALFSCSSSCTVLTSPPLLLSAGLLAERSCAPACATRRRGDLPLPVTRLHSGDLLLPLPESPLTLLGARALEPNRTPVLSPDVPFTSCRLLSALACSDRSGDLLWRCTGDLLLGDLALLGDPLLDRSWWPVSSRELLLACSCHPSIRERLRSSSPPTARRPRTWGPLLHPWPEWPLSSAPLVLLRPRSSWGPLLSEQLPRRRERLQSSPPLAPGRPWYTTRRSPAKRE